MTGTGPPGVGPPNRVRADHVDTRALLGHWLEVCQLQADDVEFFSGLVSDSA